MNFKTFFKDHPSIVVFFYTRCENHNKCSLTINKLGRLQRLLKEKGLSRRVKTASISYDSVFDSPALIKNYCMKRRVMFDDYHKGFRVLDRNKTSDLLSYFTSSVNFNGSLVNKHQVELHILNKEGKIHKSFVRLQWNPVEVVETLESYLSDSVLNNRQWISPRKISLSVFNTLIPILIAFFPKCPLCWAGYLSLFGVASISSIPYSPWLLPVLCIFLGINLWFLWKRSSRTERWLSFYLASLGAAMLIFFGPLLKMDSLAMCGMILLICGSLLNSLPKVSGNWSNIFSRS